MLGTVINVATISIGSIIGSKVKKGISERYQNTIMQAVGLIASSLGITWIVSNIIKSKFSILFVVSMVIGAILGEFINLESKVEKLGKKFKENNLMEGLVTAILLFCIGTLSILGPLESALKGNNTLLFTNAILDGITSLVLASNFGIGIIISALVLFIWQGSIYMSASYIAPYVTPELLGEISIIGGILLLATGLNILKITKIKSLNLLPALIVPVLFFIIKALI